MHDDWFFYNQKKHISSEFEGAWFVTILSRRLLYTRRYCKQDDETWQGMMDNTWYMTKAHDAVEEMTLHNASWCMTYQDTKHLTRIHTMKHDTSRYMTHDYTRHMTCVTHNDARELMSQDPYRRIDNRDILWYRRIDNRDILWCMTHDDAWCRARVRAFSTVVPARLPCNLSGRRSTYPKNIFKIPKVQAIIALRLPIMLRWKIRSQGINPSVAQ